MDVLDFGVLKAFYATVVSIDRNEDCIRSWTDYKQLKIGYGNRMNSDIIKLPSSLAFIALIAMEGNQIRYADDQVEMYCTILTVISAHLERWWRRSGGGGAARAWSRDTGFWLLLIEVLDLQHKQETYDCLQKWFFSVDLYGYIM